MNRPHNKLNTAERKFLQSLVEKDDFAGLLIAATHRAEGRDYEESPKLFYEVVADFKKELKQMLCKAPIWKTLVSPTTLLNIIDADDIACEIVVSCNEVSDETDTHSGRIIQRELHSENQKAMTPADQRKKVREMQEALVPAQTGVHNTHGRCVIVSVDGKMTTISFPIWSVGKKITMTKQVRTSSIDFDKTY
jgi:hypothetical protein